MSAKRGRPLSGESHSSAINRQREQARERMRQLRIRQRESTAVPPRDTVAQIEQREIIIDLSSVAEEEAAVTSLAQGMRKAVELDLPQDRLGAYLQQNAVEEDEHNSLYPARKDVKQSVVGFFRQFATPKIQRPSSNSESSNVRDEERQAGDFSLAASGASGNDHSQSRAEDSDSPQWDLWADDASVVLDNVIESAEVPRPSLGAQIPADSNDELEEVDSAGTQPNTANTSLGSEDLLGQEQLLFASDDEESEINFQPEFEVDEEAEAAAEYTANKLYAQFQGGHHGCSEEQHEERLRKHMEEAGENHHSLDEIFHNRRFASALQCDGIMSAAELEQQRLPTAEQWEAMFCGLPVGGQQRRPMNICLHKEQTQAIEPRAAFDVDSFLAFPSSLAAFQRGVLYQPATQAMQNIQTDVHLEMNIFESANGEDETVRASKKMLRDIPHFLLGRLSGASNITIYILFPHLPIAASRDRFVSMTEEQLSRWTDRVFLPAIWKIFPAQYTQHLPPSYRVALADSKANQVEARKIETSSYRAQQAITYHLQPEYLQELWEVVLQIIGDTPGLADFREAQLFFTAKGTKLTFQSRLSKPTLLDVMEHFESYLHHVINMSFVEEDRFYIDLGKEICASVSLLQGQQQHIGEEAQVYSWKRCCLEEYMKWMYEGRPPSHKAQGQRYYHQNMLYDASSLTSVTPKLSKLRQGGLIYSQFYGSVKEMTDASKCRLFDNDALEEMALDPQLRRAARNVAGGHRREAQIVEMAYRASKRRARAAILDSKRRSFGIREEHRVTWELFQRLKVLLEGEDRDDLEIVMDDCPSYAWPIQTKTYLNFLWRSADKFATGFEVVHARSRRDMVTWEQTKMMFAFLRCLRFVMGGHRIEPESAMWWSKRNVGEEAQRRPLYGLGLCNTLPRYKYCWWEPRVDWQRLCFKPSITNGMLFGNSVLRGQAMRRGRQVTAFFDMALALERGLEWMQSNADNETIQEQVLSWMVHVCLKQFRVDVLSAVKGEMHEEHREEALKGERGFSYEYFEEIMTDGCYLMSGNRCDFKAPSLLAQVLLDREDGRSREHWEDKPFRKLYERARTGLGVQGRRLRAKFTQRYWEWLFEYHWILPYPCGNALLQTSKEGGRRMWYSIEWEEGKKGWRWGRKSWRAGRPKDVPGYVGWSEGEWKQWMGERGGQEVESEGEEGG